MEYIAIIYRIYNGGNGNEINVEQVAADYETRSGVKLSTCENGDDKPCLCDCYIDDKCLDEEGMVFRAFDLDGQRNIEFVMYPEAKNSSVRFPEISEEHIGVILSEKAAVDGE